MHIQRYVQAAAGLRIPQDLALGSMNSKQKLALASQIRIGIESAISRICTASKEDQTSFFNDEEVQVTLLKGLMAGEITDSNLIKAIVTCDDIKIANSEKNKQIWEERLPKLLGVLQNRPEAIAALTFLPKEHNLSDVDQKNIAHAIFVMPSHAGSGNTIPVVSENVRLSMCRNLHKFYAPDACVILQKGLNNSSHFTFPRAPKLSDLSNINKEKKIGLAKQIIHHESASNLTWLNVRALILSVISDLHDLDNANKIKVGKTLINWGSCDAALANADFRKFILPFVKEIASAAIYANESKIATALMQDPSARADENFKAFVLQFVNRDRDDARALKELLNKEYPDFILDLPITNHTSSVVQDTPDLDLPITNHTPSVVQDTPDLDLPITNHTPSVVQNTPDLDLPITNHTPSVVQNTPENESYLNEYDSYIQDSLAMLNTSN